LWHLACLAWTVDRCDAVIEWPSSGHVWQCASHARLPPVFSSSSSSPSPRSGSSPRPRGSLCFGRCGPRSPPSVSSWGCIPWSSPTLAASTGALCRRGGSSPRDLRLRGRTGFGRKSPSGHSSQAC
jgi:hypothetical protein